LSGVVKVAFGLARRAVRRGVEPDRAPGELKK
jgi:hypothetical protein